MINLHEINKNEHLPQITPEEISDEKVIEEIWQLKEELKDQVLILGHHYQQDEVIQFTDFTGDSLALAKKAKTSDIPYVIFCGVHFMAETADMLTKKKQKIILPDLMAGCSMADMATGDEIEQCWETLKQHTEEKIIPITYINCTAELKAFVGKNDGSICTSSNARKIIEWGLERGEKLLFFPDQHLGRNTCFDLGISLDEMVVYNPHLVNGGLTPEQIKKAKIILWHGFCSVHQGFNASQIKNIKASSPETIVIVHPECNFETVQAADLNGSTSYIIDTIEKAPAGSRFAVGTEINLVNRLAAKYTDKKIISLAPYQCLCTTMYRIRPRWLLNSFRGIKSNRPINVIEVDQDTTKYAMKALNNMLEI
ncbi:MAG: quinolinate synthase [Epsilonproteobacteria bacterium]|nr:MAG: quinolinate synthase [Campylobacterota bacterium]RLA67869.1 MAG: quinolinate synthase [Campylobacterota bacterium]